jgi:hypothetical protein
MTHKLDTISPQRNLVSTSSTSSESRFEEVDFSEEEGPKVNAVKPKRSKKYESSQRDYFTLAEISELENLELLKAKNRNRMRDYEEDGFWGEGGASTSKSNIKKAKGKSKSVYVNSSSEDEDLETKSNDEDGDRYINVKRQSKSKPQKRVRKKFNPFISVAYSSPSSPNKGSGSNLVKRHKPKTGRSNIILGSQTEGGVEWIGENKVRVDGVDIWLKEAGTTRDRIEKIDQEWEVSRLSFSTRQFSLNERGS